MQCPSCGFQNMPGVKQCVVCSASLAGEASAEDVTPPRARDRSLRQRLNCLFAFGGRMRSDYSTAAASGRVGNRLWSCAGAIRLVVLSVVPGFSHLFVLGRSAVGMAIFLASAAALVLAAVLYRSPLSNLLVYGVILASAFSVFCTAARIATAGARREAVPRLQLGVGLMVAAFYLALYNAAIVALDPVVQVLRVLQHVPAIGVRAGDSVALWKRGDILRGDLVAVWIHYERDVLNMLRIYGVPGDTVEISDGQLYINAKPVEARLPSLYTHDGIPAPGALSPAKHTLRRDQYFVIPNFDQIPSFRELLETGTVNEADIVGRVVAIVNPPEHRRLVSRASNIER